MTKRKQTGSKTRPHSRTKRTVAVQRQRHVRWSFRRFDSAFPRGDPSDGSITALELVETFKALEEIRLEQLVAGGTIGASTYGSQQVKGMPQAAQKRLRDLNLGDYERIVRIRVGGTKRVYGLPPDEDGVIAVLWLDPGHRVSNPKK